MSKKVRVCIELEFPSNITDESIEHAVKNAMVAHVDTDNDIDYHGMAFASFEGFDLISCDVISKK